MAKRSKGAAGTPATLALDRAGIGFVVHSYAHDPATSSGSYGEEAAAALGVDPTQMFKTLLVQADQRVVVAVTPVSTQLDLKALARAVGGKRATMADPSAAERLTGYVVGGISPIGQRTALETLLDESAAGLESMFVSAGRRGLSLELAPADLIAATGAVLAPVARE